MRIPVNVNTKSGDEVFTFSQLTCVKRFRMTWFRELASHDEAERKLVAATLERQFNDIACPINQFFD